MLIGELLNKSQIKGVIGLEFEVEGRGLPEDTTPSWRSVHEGSLRGGREYISSKPLLQSTYKNHVAKLTNILSEAPVRFSNRTSTHVHINVRDLTIDQLLSFVFLFCTYEKALIDFSGDSRDGNHFCLKTSDAEGVFEVIRALQENKSLGVIPVDVVRYCAVNLEAVTKFGSLEFRSLEGTLDNDRIFTWVDTLLAMKNIAKDFQDYEGLVSYMQSVGVMNVANKLLPKGIDYNRFKKDIKRSFLSTRFHFKTKKIKTKTVVAPPNPFRL